MYRLKCDLHINQTLHTETFMVAPIMLGINHYRHADQGYCGCYRVTGRLSQWR